MPRIVTYDQQTQTPQGGLTTRVEAPGQMIGEAIHALGEQGEKTFGEAAKRQLLAKKADVRLSKQGDVLMHDAEHGFLNKRGEDAAAAFPALSKSLDEAYRQASAGLDPETQGLFDSVAHRKLADLRERAVSHSAQQSEAAALDISAQRGDQAMDTAAADFAAGRPTAMNHLNIAHSEAATQSRLQGLDEAQTNTRLRAINSEVLARAAAIQIPDNPHAAIRTLDEHGDRMDPGAVDLLHDAATRSAAEQDAGRHVDDAFAAIRPPLAPGVTDILPADAHPPVDPDIFAQHCFDHAGDDPGVKAAAWSLGRMKAIQANRAQTARARDLASQTHAAMAKGAVSPAALPPQLRLGMAAATREGFQRFAEAGGFAEVTDALAHGGLYAMMADDLPAFLDHDLTGAAAQLTSHDFAALTQDQQTLRQGGPVADALRQRIGWIDAAAQDRLADLGVDPQAEPDTRAAAVSEIKTASDLEQAANPGKALDAERIGQIAQAAFGRGWIRDLREPSLPVEFDGEERSSDNDETQASSDGEVTSEQVADGDEASPFSGSSELDARQGISYDQVGLMSGTGDSGAPAGEDEEGNATLQKAAYVRPAPQRRPGFAALWRSFPVDTNKSPESAYAKLGRPDASAWAKNACTARMCMAIHDAGGRIVPPPGAAKIYGRGAYARTPIILNVRSFDTAMRRDFGPPTVSLRSEDGFAMQRALQGRQGIIEFHVQWSNATGHFDLLDRRGNCRDKCYFDPRERQGAKLTGVDFWEMPD